MQLSQSTCPTALLRPLLPPSVPPRPSSLLLSSLIHCCTLPLSRPSYSCFLSSFSPHLYLLPFFPPCQILSRSPPSMTTHFLASPIVPFVLSLGLLLCPLQDSLSLPPMFYISTIWQIRWINKMKNIQFSYQQYFIPTHTYIYSIHLLY